MFNPSRRRAATHLVGKWRCEPIRKTDSANRRGLKRRRRFKSANRLQQKANADIPTLDARFQWLPVGIHIVVRDAFQVDDNVMDLIAITANV